VQINLNMPPKNPDRPRVPDEPPKLFERLAIWHVAPAARGAGQMALDEVMLRLAEEPTMRLYRWQQPEVTIGYPQHWEDAQAFAGDRPITRRCTGGGFVEHGADLTIALAVPATHPFARLAPAEAYRRIHEAIRAGLDDAEVRLATEAECTCGPACFASPALHDVMRGGHKILGGAQRRSREGFLYQGSLRDADFANAAAAFSDAVELWRPPAGWETIFEGLVSTRYGAEAWNRRR
jgi:lipoate-protein ligase A